MNLGAIGFLSPWFLLGLFALPAIWWLLRFTPPKPRRILFPPTRLLAGLKSKERTPAHSPWWLTALRALIVGALILAFARPVYDPERIAFSGTGPILLIIDNGWGAASRWNARQDAMNAAIAAAERQGRSLILVPTAGPLAGDLASATPLSPASARERSAGLAPLPYAPERTSRLDALVKALTTTHATSAGHDIIWLSDGLDYGHGQDFIGALARLAGTGGSVRIYRENASQSALALRGGFGPDGRLRADVLALAGAAGRAGMVQALSGRGEVLAEQPFRLAVDPAAPAGLPGLTAPANAHARLSFALPLELRNQTASLRIAGEASAAAVHLLDSRSRWRRIGILTGEPREQAQPLLSPSYYVERALKPYADLIAARTRNLDQGTEELLAQAPSVLILTDVGRLPLPAEAQIRAWVKRGGMLIRFAGPRLAQGDDSLLPVRLLQGERVLGGALSWSTPQHLAPFEATGPFAGLRPPADVTVSRQVLADPSGGLDGAAIWVRLKDGTPLVTARKLGRGRLVLFHASAGPDWSNLPLSGAFVEMLRASIGLSAAAGVPPAGAQNKAAASTANDLAGDLARAATPAASDIAHAPGLLAPLVLLNGFGQLGGPSSSAMPVPADQFATLRPGPQAPPGLYGPPGQTRALNLITASTSLRPLPDLPAKADIVRYNDNRSQPLGQWLFLTALIVLAAESLIVSWMMSGGLRLPRSARGNAALALITLSAAAFLLLASAAPTAAQTGALPLPAASHAPAEPSRPPDAVLATHLAYVRTGNSETDDISRAGLYGLSRILQTRTAVEPAEPIGLDIAHDELVFYPLIYWPVRAGAKPLDEATLAKVDAYMKQGGMILFDTQDQLADPLSSGSRTGSEALQRLIGRLDLPPLEPVPATHVLTRAFYLIDSFPGRWDGGKLWVEAQPRADGNSERRALKSDGVSAILITSNDFAAAWALDTQDRPLFPVVPGGDVQRELAYRVGINIVMYALTGNYKADQVHLPALLERLGQ